MYAADNDSPNERSWELSAQERGEIRKTSRSRLEADEKISIREKKRKSAWEVVNNTEKLRDLLADLIEQIRKANDDAGVAQQVNNLRKFLKSLEDDAQRIPSAIGDEVANQLVPIARERRAKSPVPINPFVTIIARYGKSGEAKKFILEMLSESDLALRNDSIVALAWSQNLRGDEAIFDCLQKIYQAEGGPNTAALGVMARLDRKKTLPILIEAINSTRDITQFIRLSDAISEYGQPELLAPILRRVKDFPRAPFGTRRNATTGIYPDLLLRFVEQAEDEQLEIALDVLEQTALAQNRSHSVIGKKLESLRPRSNAAALRFIQKASLNGAYSDDELRQLESKIERLSDSNLIKDKEEALKGIRQRLKKKAP